MFADNGYHDALVDEIGQRTSISKGGLYFHFPSKEDLFFAVMDRLADKLVTRAEKAALNAESPLGAAEAAMDDVLSTLSSQKRLARLLITQGYTMGNAFESKRAEIFNRFARVIGEQLHAAKEAGQIREKNTDLASLVWLGAMNEVIVHWLFSFCVFKVFALVVFWFINIKIKSGVLAKCFRLCICIVIWVVL